MTPWNYLDLAKNINDVNLIYTAIIQPDLNINNKLDLYDKKPELLGWMSLKDKTDIPNILANHKKLSQKIKTYCQSNSLTYFDTENNYEESINLAFNHIQKLLSKPL